MTAVVVTTDDVCPESIRALWHHWDQLKAAHPALKVTCFVPARFHNDVKNDIYKSREFREWFRQRKGWVEVAAHGLFHEGPKEFKKFSRHQERFVARMVVKLRRYLPGCPGFKAPFNELREDVTVPILERAGFAYVVGQDSVRFLVEMEDAQKRPPFIIIRSHTNVSDRIGGRTQDCLADNINLCKVTLHKRLKYYERMHCSFVTMSEYVERWRA